MPVSKARFGVRRPRLRVLPTLPILRPFERDYQSRSTTRDPKWCVCVVKSVDETSEQRQAVREGIILDAGASGARVRFRSKSTLPSPVWIKASRIGLHRLAHVIWQDEFDAGLAFIDH